MKLAIMIVAASAVAGLAQNAGTYRASKEGGNYMWNYYIPPAPSTTPWAPAWSPDGRSIAVAMYGSIWKVDPATGVAKELTYNSKYHSLPAWSPDGKWLVYTADDNGRDIQLEILNVRSGETHALTTGNDIYLDPVFSPDGRKLAYVSTRPKGYFDIYIRPIGDGQWTGPEVALTRDYDFGHERLYVGRWDLHIEPSWTPDGKEIVFVSNHGVPLGSGNVWRMPAEANGGAQATMVLEEQTLFRTRPDVSIDGKRIVYSSTAGAADQYDQLYVVPVRGGAPYKLTFQQHDHFQPKCSPDGEWIAYISNEGGLPQLALIETYGGTQRRILITKREWKRPMGRVHVRVIDDATGKETAARIHSVASDGKFYAPSDAYSRITMTDRHVFHSTGEFTAEVPPGKTHIEAMKGFEHQPTEVDIGVEANQTANITLHIKRISNMQVKGWYAGSTHVHMNYGGNLLNTIPNMVMMSEAEDQNELNLLAANKDNRILDWQYFVPGGGEHPISRGKPGIKVLLGEEYRPPFYGHVFFLGLKDHLISPFTTGYEGTGIESLYPSNTDMFRKASAEGAVTGYVHPWTGDADPLEHDLGVAKGFPVDLALRTVQCLEWSYATHAAFGVWFHALNLDLTVAPTGGEDSISNLHRSKMVASVRTYAYTGKNFGVKTWLEALRQGHTMFTTGPLLEFHVNGKLPGDAIKLPAGGGSIELDGSVTSLAPLTKVVIYNNGKVVKDLVKEGPFKLSLPVTHSGWYVLYAEGPPDKHLDAAYAQAATNAVRVYVGDEPIRDPESAAYFVRWIDKLQSMAEAWPGWRSEAEKRHVFGQFAEARRIYERMR